MHRDIKPSNIWLEKVYDRVKILDFGLARTADDGALLTFAGTLLGTPGYVAPEQARGKPDPQMRSDLFSLGCVLYELCTGVPPFTGETVWAVLWATQHYAPDPPGLVVGGLPAELSALVMKLLAKDPANRYQDAREVAAALASCLAPRAEPSAVPQPRPPRPSALVHNPFVWRAGITEGAAFFNRSREQRLVQEFVHKRQNCQLVGPRRIGKTSLLLQLERVIPLREPKAIVARLDLQLPQCFSLSGWLQRAGRQFGWKTPPAELAEFAERVEEMLAEGSRPILYLDEFAELTLRPREFTRDFFSTLRACGQQGLSIVTASDRPLSELTDPTDRVVSPFYNTFPLVRLGAFSHEDTAAFVALERPGVPAFTPRERAAILEFAQGHPLALQVACFRVLEERGHGETLEAILRRAAEDMSAHLPSWGAAAP
jgi:serine/threonine protein kinase